MKIVQQSLIWPATYVHLLHDGELPFNGQGDITLTGISLLLFYEKRQSLSVDPQFWVFAKKENRDPHLWQSESGTIQKYPPFFNVVPLWKRGKKDEQRRYFYVRLLSTEHEIT